MDMDPLEKLSMEVSVQSVDWLRTVSEDAGRGIQTPLPLPTRRMKRLLDLTGVTLGLILLSPVMLLTTIVVKLSSPGEAIFSQTRVGLNRRNLWTPDRRANSQPAPRHKSRRSQDRRQCTGYGRHFTLYKFRTMVIDAEKNGAQFAQENDPRVTTLGRFMRKSRLDELPQLWNVLVGDMSLVGPRPERPEFIADSSREVPHYLDQLQLKPGLTGIAQIVNGYDNNIESFKRKVAYDLLYLPNCSVMNDLKILLRTVRIVLTGKGAM